MFLSAAGTITLLNRQVLEYFGKTTEDLKGSPTFEAVHPDDLPRVIGAWRHWLETGQPHDLDFRQRRADGVYRWFQSAPSLRKTRKVVSPAGTYC